jgi:hypothetical protein
MTGCKSMESKAIRHLGLAWKFETVPIIIKIYDNVLLYSTNHDREVVTDVTNNIQKARTINEVCISYPCKQMLGTFSGPEN